MFDDLDDDDVTDLIPDSEAERKEKKHLREQEQRGRRMTVSEVRKIEKHVHRITTNFDFSRIPVLTDVVNIRSKQ